MCFLNSVNSLEFDQFDSSFMYRYLRNASLIKLLIKYIGKAKMATRGEK